MEASRRKIVFLITSLGFGGAETQLYRLAISLKQRGWGVKVVTMCAPQAFEKEFSDNGIFVYSLNIPKGAFDLKSFFRFLEILKKERPDILHSHMIHANFLARIARLFSKVPIVICTAHNVYEGGSHRLWWYRLTDFLCDMTTQVSEVGVQKYLKEKVVNPRKLLFVPNGVNTNLFKKDDLVRQKVRNSLALDGCFVWLAVGRFQEAKDYSNMLNAFVRVCKGKDNSILLIVGEGVLRQKVQSLAEELGISNRVRFLGIRRDISDLMSTADAYVMSSAWEGMPMVLLEAAACGLPIVTTDVGGNKEAIKQGESGFLVPCKQPEKLADAMVRLMALPTEGRLNMGKTGRQLIVEKYNLEHVVDMWEELYKRLLTEKNA